MIESILIWAIAALLIAVVLIPYLIKFRIRRKQDMARKKEAETLGIDRPRAQFPFVNVFKCIGCGACVESCPEGDVLGVVYGKATVINGLRCVGHGFCEQVCPVQGIKVGLGDIKTRPDIPILSAENETSAPGIYIAGELGGLSLIRNAVAQGQLVVESIAEKIKQTANNGIKDVIIVGAGPAGLSAALTAVKNNLSYLLLDQQEPGGTVLQYPRKKLVMTRKIEIPLYGRLKKEEYSKEELLEIWKDILTKHKLNFQSNHKLENIDKPNGHYRLFTNNGTFESKKVVLALGRRGTPRKLNVPGEDMAKVSYQLIDAQSYTNSQLLVVGGGDSAVEAAIGLARQKGNTVTVSYRKSRFFRIKKKNEDRINQAIHKKEIKPLFNSSVLEIKEKSVILKVQDKTVEIPNDYVFIFAGGIPPFEMLKDMGITFGGEMQEIN